MHWPCSGTRQSHIIEYGVSKIVPEGQWEGNKSHARDTARFQSQAVHMYADVQSEPSQRVTKTGTCGPCRAPLRGCIRLHPILYSIHSTATDWRWVMSHANKHPVRNRTPLTTRSSCLRRVSATDHHTAEQYSKTGWTKPWTRLTSSDLSWNTRQDFLKIPSLWEAALETERRYFSNVILKSHVTTNIKRSSDSFSTGPPIVIGGAGDALCVPWRPS